MHDNVEKSVNTTAHDPIGSAGHLKGSDELTALTLSYDWSSTSVGDRTGWSQSLTTVLDTMLASRFPMCIGWGDDVTLFYNDAYIPFLGQKHPAALGKPMASVWNDVWADIQPLIVQAMSGETVAFDDLPLTMERHGHAEETWWTFCYSPLRDDDGIIAGFLNVASETTSKQHLRTLNATLEQRVVERSEALLLYQDVFQSDPNPACAFDTNHAIVAFNQAFSDEFFRVYGHRARPGETFPALFLPDQGEVITGYLDRALAGEAFTITERFGHPDLASPMWEIFYNPLRAGNGEIIGAVQHGVDITEQVNAEEQLASAQEALRQAQKMEAVGQLTGGLAHDFNNLLTGMMGNLELLQARIARGRLDDIDRFINAAQGAGRRAASLTQRLLAFSRRQTLDPKPTDVNRLITGMEDMLRRTVGGASHIEIVGAGGLWTANIDAGQLENALLNLCINARDAMPDGGRITIETANKWLDDRTGKERDLSPGQYLSICVTDTGSGMSAETIARAFEPFYTTKPIGQGTGLGLSMIYGFARQSGGQVRIYSEIGEGTTVCVYLPRHLGDAEETEADETALTVAGATGQTILVVDDEATIRHLIDEVLDEAGYTVIGAADGAAGIKVLQSGARIELLITDVGLPNGMNGRQVADAARILRPGLKVLFITGYAENAAVGNGHLEAGMELLTKPFSMEALAAKVGEMMEGNCR